MASSNKKVDSDINQRPFLGLRSFEENNKAQFGGRDEEIQELFDLVDTSSLTVVFGKSGIGKTSLLKAGLIPELRENFYFPIYIRIDYSSQKTPFDQVKESIYENMKTKDPSIDSIGEVTLWEFFHNVNMLDGLITPVLILDQFEETFTIGDQRKQDVIKLINELADLAENRIPLSVQESYQNRNETVPARFSEQPYRVVFSLREDFLARLEELKGNIPSIMDRRFRVVQMSVKQALDAATKPSQGLLSEEVARDIIKKLPGVSQNDFDLLDQGNSNQNKLKVEPFLLSLLCDRINEKRISKKLNKITSRLVSKFNVKDVINSFYNDTIKNYNKKLEHAIEDRLLTEGGFRKLQAVEEFKRTYSISNNVIEELVDGRILRKEIRDGVGYVELIHDVLAPIIKENRDIRHDREKEEERKAAIKLAKQKNRKKIISIASVAGVIMLGVLAFAILTWREKTEIEKRDKKFNLAQNLLNESRDLVEMQGEFEKAALVSRLAYLVYKDSKGNSENTNQTDIYDEFFYNSMYSAIKKVDILEPLQLARIAGKVGREEMQLKTFEYVSPNEIYIAMSDGSIREIQYGNMKKYPKKYSFLNKAKRSGIHSRSLPFMTSMTAFNEGENRYLAMVGNRDSIYIVDRERNNTESIIKKFRINNKRAGKYIAHRNKGELVVKQLRSLLKWDNIINDDNPSIWSKRDEVSYYDGDTVTKPNKTVKWESDEFKIGRNRVILLEQEKAEDKDKEIELKFIEYEGSNYRDFSSDNIDDYIKFYSFSVSDKYIAIGVLGGVILLTEHKYLEIRYDVLKNKRVTAIKIDSEEKSLILGTNKSELFELPLNGVIPTSIKPIGPKLHSEVIVDITTQDSLVATASWDGTVGLYKRGNNNNLIPLKTFNAYMAGEHRLSKVINVKFIDNGRFLVAGYSNGNVLKWPTTIDILEDVIKHKITDSLDSGYIEKLNAFDLDIDLKKYLKE